MKTVEQMFDEKQTNINKAIKKKEFRQTKTELNINFSWAVNNANAFLEEKYKGTNKGFQLIKKWYPKFIELYREWAVENIPIEPLEPIKLTKEDFAKAKEEAPRSQALQDKADELEEGKIKDEENTKVEEQLPSIEI